VGGILSIFKIIILNIIDLIGVHLYNYQ